VARCPSELLPARGRLSGIGSSFTFGAPAGMPRSVRISPLRKIRSLRAPFGNSTLPVTNRSPVGRSSTQGAAALTRRRSSERPPSSRSSTSSGLSGSSSARCANAVVEAQHARATARVRGDDDLGPPGSTPPQRGLPASAGVVQQQRRIAESRSTPAKARWPTTTPPTSPSGPRY
jgi:hypothetical protein